MPQQHKILSGTYFESFPEGRYEVVVGHGVSPIEARAEVVGIGISVEDARTVGDFAIQVSSEQFAEVRAVIVGEVIPAQPLGAA